uniref:DNA-binding response regulator n=1 Tax=Thermosporothrix sp. COM3 TaxID=2490863 RepID=A0A455SMF3_9CHLR|nr:DNA-binding response regulator [Thermosporothrix sp. COM3]
MGLVVLIAEPHDILRAGIRAIFAEDTRVEAILEAVNEEEVTRHLRKGPHLTIINQQLIQNMSCLPPDKFVVLTHQPDLEMLKDAFKYKARGYLSVNTPADILRALLHPLEGAFFIGPMIAPWIMNHIIENSHFAIQDDLLTPREKEVVGLLREGIDRSSIARKLNIAETTLKTHMKNISKKTRSLENVERY